MNETSSKRPIWDYLFYFSMFVLTVWLILKVAGVIKTPVWLEYGIPIGSFILGLVTFFQSINNKFERVFSSISDLRTNDARMEGRLMHLDRDLERLKDAIES